MSAGETVGEVLTTLITIGGLLILRDMSFVTDSSGTPIPFFDPAMTTFWFPVLIAVLVALGPEFAAEIGWPELAENGGIVMLGVTVGVTLVSGWEIVDAFRRARRAQRRAVVSGAAPTAN